jgi:putative peptidoglycan lipid II flippase
LSIGLAACLNAALLYWQLRKQKILPSAGLVPVPAAPGHCGDGYVGGAAGRDVPDAGVVAGDDAVPPAAPDGGRGGGVVAYFATLLLLGFRVKEFARRTA